MDAPILGRVRDAYIANDTHEVVQMASVVTIHALRAGDTDTAKHFGELTGDDVDKFKDIEWTDGPEGNPVLGGVDWFGGSVLQRIDCGDHVGLLLEPVGGACEHAEEPGLTLRAVAELEPGHQA